MVVRCLVKSEEESGCPSSWALEHLGSWFRKPSITTPIFAPMWPPLCLYLHGRVCRSCLFRRDRYHFESTSICAVRTCYSEYHNRFEQAIRGCFGQGIFPSHPEDYFLIREYPYHRRCVSEVEEEDCYEEHCRHL